MPLPPIRAAAYLWGLVVSVTAAAMVALAEIETQSARIADPAGHGWPFSVLFGSGGERTTGWQELAAGGMFTAAEHAVFQRLLWWHLGVDLVFMISYGILLAGLVHAVFRKGLGRQVGYGLVLGTVLCDLAEDQLVASMLVGPTPTVVPGALSVATTLKWVLLAATVLTVIIRAIVPYTSALPDDPRPTLRRTVRALMQHRFSLAFVVPLLVLTVLSGSAVLEQLPDVQRRWVTDGADGQRQALLAVLVLGVCAGLLALLGRERTRWARRHPIGPGPAPEQPGLPVLGIWLVGPAVALLGAVLAPLFTDAAVLTIRLVIFCAVSALVIVLSLLLRRWWSKHPAKRVPDRPQRFTADELATIRFTGHALALASLTIGGLGLIRSFMSMVILRPELETAGLTAEQTGRAERLFALGVLAVVLPWLIGLVIAMGRRPDPTPVVSSSAVAPLWPRWLVLAAVVATFFFVAWHPGTVAGLGVSAVAIIGLAALVGIPAASGLLIQDRPTAEVFRALGLRRTPLVSVLVICIVAVGALSGQTTIDRVVDGSPSVPDSANWVRDRPSANDLVEHWESTEQGCELSVDGHRVRPMIMVAAEGGGILAAYWTVKGLQAIEDGTSARAGCGARSVLFSAGASGGSVGLTVARFSGTPGTPDTAQAVAAVRQMARPQPLAQGVVGTFVRDPLYGATGVPIGSDGIAPARTWADRARLLEIGWSGGYASDSSWGTRDFLSPEATLSPATGTLILNSTSVADRCRVWVSQVSLPAPLAGGDQGCDLADATGPRTIDLLSAYATDIRQPAAGDTSTADCLHGLQAVTAAMLTARFPYVTPGGVVGPCSPTGADGPTWPRTQLIDGGYTENSGLATITDLSVAWLAQVRSHNEQVMTSGSSEPLIVPFVVFLTNEEGGASQLRPAARLQSELLLPPVEYLSGQGTLNTNEALLRRASDAVATTSICPEVADPRLDCAAISARFPHRVIVVDRPAEPEVTAPLGWVLSDASMAGMDAAMGTQAGTRCADQGSGRASTDPGCLRGYGAMGDLLGYLDH